jgi:hypothetical protein
MLFDGDHVDVVTLTVCHKDGNPKEYLYSHNRGFMRDKTHEIPVGAQAEMYRKMIFSGRAWDSSITTTVRVVHRAHEATKADIAEQNCVLDAAVAQLHAESAITSVALGVETHDHETEIYPPQAPELQTQTEGNEALDASIQEMFPIAFESKERQFEMAAQLKKGFDRIRTARVNVFDVQVSHRSSSVIVAEIPETQHYRLAKEWFLCKRFKAIENYTVCAVQFTCPFVRGDQVILQLKDSKNSNGPTINVSVDDADLNWAARQYMLNVETQVMADRRKETMSVEVVRNEVDVRENAIRVQVIQSVSAAFEFAKSKLGGALVEYHNALHLSKPIERMKILCLLSRRIANCFGMLCSDLPMAAQLEKLCGTGFMQYLPISLMKKLGEDVPEAVQTLCHFSNMCRVEAVHTDDGRSVERFMYQGTEVTEERAEMIFAGIKSHLGEKIACVAKVMGKDQAQVVAQAIGSFGRDVAGASRSCVIKEILLEEAGANSHSAAVKDEVTVQLETQFTARIFCIRKSLIETSRDELPRALMEYSADSPAFSLVGSDRLMTDYCESRCLIAMCLRNDWFRVAPNELIIEGLFGSEFLAAVNVLRDFVTDVLKQKREMKFFSPSNQENIEQSLETIKTTLSNERSRTNNDVEVKDDVEKIAKRMCELDSSKKIIDQRTERSLLAEANGRHRDDETQRAVEAQARVEAVWGAATEPDPELKFKPEPKHGLFYNFLFSLGFFHAASKTKAFESLRVAQKKDRALSLSVASVVQEDKRQKSLLDKIEQLGQSTEMEVDVFNDTGLYEL